MSSCRYPGCCLRFMHSLLHSFGSPRPTFNTCPLQSVSLTSLTMMVFSSAERTMASKPPRKNSSARSSSSRLSSSATEPSQNENEPPKTSPKTSPKTTTPTPQSDASITEKKPGSSAPKAVEPDAFETADNSDTEEGMEGTRASIDLDELPIELIQLIDKYGYRLLRTYLHIHQLTAHQLRRIP